MSLPQIPPVPAFGPVQISSISTAITATPTNPINWVYVSSAGSGGLVVKDQGGTARTYSGLTVGQVVYGPFTELTSMTVAGLWYGSGLPPVNNNQSPSGLNGATVPAGGSLTTGNALQVTAAGALGYGPVQLDGGVNYVTGIAPWFATAANKTTAFSAAVDTIYNLNFTSAVVVDLPAITASNSGHAIGFVNIATSVAVLTPNGTQGIGGSAASSATAAGATAGGHRIYIANAALSRWLPLSVSG